MHQSTQLGKKLWQKNAFFDYFLFSLQKAQLSYLVLIYVYLAVFSGRRG